MFDRRYRWLTLVTLILLMVGCGDGRPKRVPVSGQVLIDDQPLKYGFISFFPDSGRPAGGRLDANGRFVLGCFERSDGVMLGMHKIAVRGGEYRNDAETYWHAPKKYNDYNTSGLTEEIKGPKDDLVIKLTWDGKQPFLESHKGIEKFRPGREPMDH